jgi:hypothetical protein
LARKQLIALSGVTLAAALIALSGVTLAAALIARLGVTRASLPASSKYGYLKVSK